MATGSPPTVQRRQLGRELRRLREEAGVSAETLAEELGCSMSRISRIENARIRIAPGTVHEILDVLRIEGTDRARLIALARAAERSGWWQQFGDALTYDYATYIALESEARALRVFEPVLIHGLLQTEDYARHLHARVRVDLGPTEIEPLVKARMARQAVLTKPDPLDYRVLLDEGALHRQVGGPEVMREQLEHLAEMAALPNVRLQITPFAAGSHVVPEGAYTIVDPLDAGEPSVVYIEHPVGATYLERPEAVADFAQRFDIPVGLALDPGRSARLIREIAAQPSRPGRERGQRR